jgi:N-acetyl sugar amidotransferase
MLGQRRTPYQICAQCIMDTTDPEIVFDAAGVCNHCHRYARTIAADTLGGSQGRAALEAVAARIRRDGSGKPYDCVIGLSGGVDSSYIAYLTRQLGLRPLAVHVDNGWNSEVATRNIENIVTRLNIDLVTKVLDWEEFRSLQVAFLRSSTPDCEVATDHAIAAVLYRMAIRHGIKHLVHGTNLATEQMMPRTWSYGHFDWRYIRAVAAAHGGRPLKTFPHYTVFELEVSFPYLHRLREVLPLNMIDYDKAEALSVLKRELDWQAYGAKHHESIYTRFHQTWLLPKKFGVDKRRSHLSCLINAGQLSRGSALLEIARPPLDAGQLEIDRQFVIKKLGLSEAEFAAIAAAPIRSFWQYPSYEAERPFLWERVLGRAQRTFRELRGAAAPEVSPPPVGTDQDAASHPEAAVNLSKPTSPF